MGAQSRGPRFDFSEFVGQKGSAYVRRRREHKEENKLRSLNKFSKFNPLNKTIQLIGNKTFVVVEISYPTLLCVHFVFRSFLTFLLKNIF